jgi:hypothetical protein
MGVAEPGSCGSATLLTCLIDLDADPIQCDVLYRCSESHNPDVASHLLDASHRVMLRAVRRVSRRSVCIAGNADSTPRLLDEFARCRGTPARGRCQYQSALGHLLRVSVSACICFHPAQA